MPPDGPGINPDDLPPQNIPPEDVANVNPDILPAQDMPTGDVTNVDPNILQPQEIAPVVDETTSELGGVALDAEVSQSDSKVEPFYLETPNQLDREYSSTYFSLDRAKKDAATKQYDYDSYGWLRKRLDGANFRDAQGRAVRAQERLALAKQEHSQSLEKAKQYIDQMHEQADQYVSSWQKYAETQQKLAEATGSPVLSVMGIEDFIEKSESNYEGNRDLRAGLFDQWARYAALRDFLAPSSEESTEFLGRYTRSWRKVPRLDLGLPLEQALEQIENQEGAKLLQITDFFVPSIRHGRLIRDLVYAAPKKTTRYIVLTPELSELFEGIDPEKLNFRTYLYAEKEPSWEASEVAMVGSEFEIISAEDAQEQMEAEQLPYKATLKYAKKVGIAGREGTELQEVEIGAESEEELRKRVLEFAAEEGEIPDIQIDGHDVGWIEFFKGENSPGIDEEI